MASPDNTPQNPRSSLIAHLERPLLETTDNILDRSKPTTQHLSKPSLQYKAGSQTSQSIPSPRSSASSNKSENGGVSATVCSNCATTSTPLWRRAPNGETICNACGLYLKARNTLRPVWLKRNSVKKSPAQPAHESTGGSCPGDGHCNGTGGSTTCDGCPAYNQQQTSRQALVCENCRTTTTPLWRRDEAGNTICNACGLYYKLHNVHRPVTMKRSVIKRRKRVALASSPQPHHHHHHHHHHHSQQQKHNHHRIAASRSSEDDDTSDHPPTLSHEFSSGETASGTDEDDEDGEEEEELEEEVVVVEAEEKMAPMSRKRKANDGPSQSAKRLNVRSSPVPAIEDYLPKHGNVVPTQQVQKHQQYQHHQQQHQHQHQQHQHQHQQHQHQQHQQHQQQSFFDAAERESPGPVEPSAFHNASPSEVQIHHTPVTSEPSAYVTTNGSPKSSHGILALLNPTTSTTNQQQPPSISLPNLSSITAPLAQYPQPDPVNRFSHFPAPTQAADLAAAHTHQVLAAHRQELQREVTNLSVLLKRTAAMLSNLDYAMATANQPNQPSSLPGILGTNNPLAPIMTLSNVASSSAYIQSPSNPTKAVDPSPTSLPPLQPHHPLQSRHPSSIVIPDSPARSGSCSPRQQQLPTPPPSGPTSSPTILPLPMMNDYPRA